MRKIPGVVFLTGLWLVSGLALWAMSSSEPQSAEELLEAIRGHAVNHADSKTPMKTEFIAKLYENNDFGISAIEIAKTYEDTYNETRKRSLIEKIFPFVGWGVGGITLVLLVLELVAGRVVSHLFSRVVTAIAEWAYRHFAEISGLRGIGRWRYRKAILRRYEYMQMRFCPRDGHFRTGDFYVPLRMVTKRGEFKDIEEVVQNSRQVLVKGPPGSGKSMLMMYMALKAIDRNLVYLKGRPLPILVELERMNKPGRTLHQCIAEVLRELRYPKADYFTQPSRRSQVLLLLDGLDEVASSERGRVVQEIYDWVQYSEVSPYVVVTCRTAVYAKQLDDLVAETMNLVEFDNQRVYRFLQRWQQYMPEQKSAEHLMQVLRDRPRIMDLASNPLLLTIIAYLYTETAFEIPRSRGEFFKEAINELLDIRHADLNDYERAEKFRVLEHLALFGLDSSATIEANRQSLEYEVVMEQLRKFLPSVNLDPEEASRSLLNEIVERSGLLLSLDNGERYKFAHLNLQEYFAASKLRAEPAGLLSRFKDDSDAWLEVARLWCAIADDCTTVLKDIYQTHPVSALACLSDARHVESALAKEIVDAHATQLPKAADDHTLAHALGSLAAVSRPRGLELRGYLVSKLHGSKDSRTRMGAANALSYTYLPTAAESLAECYIHFSEVREPLKQMGDSAVSAYLLLAKEGVDDALDDLLQLGTPFAIESLITLLNDEDTGLATAAAWRLAAFFPDTSTEVWLRRYEFSLEASLAGKFKWIWEPFGEPEDSCFPAIAGQIAALMCKGPIDRVRSERQSYLDPRFAIPICTVATDEQFEKSKFAHVHVDLSDLETTKIGGARVQEKGDKTVSGDVFLTEDLFKQLKSLDQTKKSDFLDGLVKQSMLSERTKKILLQIPSNLRAELLKRLLAERKPTERDWRNIFHPLKYEFRRSWLYWAILLWSLGITTLAAVKVVQEMIAQFSILPAFSPLGMSILGVVVSVVLWLVLLVNGGDPLLFQSYVTGPVFPFLATEYRLLYRTNKLKFAGLVLAHIAMWLPAAITCFWAFRFLREHGLSPLSVFILFAVSLTTGCLLWGWGQHRERAARNPLHGLLPVNLAQD